MQISKCHIMADDARNYQDAAYNSVKAEFGVSRVPVCTVDIC